ncbi:3-phosphoshikimate 1-carboxyvinyltransferase [Coxiella endosymbiont of Amblyomma nuttalli]|uniref:3-phosphoshikimate 1-carboxyvinyltransferase n=1 Tax=Coxiella endosymbiont of Amblyomma nuttalli TaxID=2749996 RepID=UPI001BA8D6F5|nr:3-phosphoshikimate 1-carboxyvinyltransferase [Coxiella endosymbiont of Amblyomma nuttalli]QTS83871.1 3-phosphoshikimate 1-carboxyvinyltransferase [Coxiella endosymbiont of Amblyomma nuttalli]
MDYQITPSKNLNGEIHIPGDKSISHRAVMLAAIAQGRTQVNGFLMGVDNLATINAFQQMGVLIEIISDKNILLIDGVGINGLRAPPDVLYCGNSGTTIRLLTGLLAGQSFNTMLTGDQSLQHRPMGRILDPLIQMGAKIDSTENFPPLRVYGHQNLVGIRYQLSIASAQIKSSLLLAGLYAKGETCIKELASSRDHTERLLKHFRYPIRIENNSVCISGGGTLKANVVSIPGDISSAAFFIVAATITAGSVILLREVGINFTRLGVINLLKMMGADIEIINRNEKNGEPIGDITVRYAKLRGIEIPQEQIPLAIDELPVLLIAAAAAKGQTVLRGAKELRMKETDRIAAMTDGLQRIGIQVKPLPDGMILTGGTLMGGEIDSYQDHRIAMAFAIAGAIAKNPTKIRHCDNVGTSFPNFTELANDIGMNIKAIVTE